MNLAVATALISAAAGLGGVAVEGWIAALGQKKQRQHDRAKTQLNEFHAPLLGMTPPGSKPGVFPD
jgi:hypothetical protein